MLTDFYINTLSKFIGIQNILFTIIFNLTDIHMAKWYHFIKLSLVIPYRNIHYLKKGKPLYLIELCYILMYVNWFYLFNDLILLNDSEKYYRNILYNNSFIYSTTILTLASFATKDTITWRKMIANTKTAIHADNGFLFLMLQKHNIENNVDTDFNIWNIMLAATFYFVWLICYNKIMYKNLISENTDYNNMVTKVFDSNLTLYNITHIPLVLMGLIFAYYAYYNYFIQQFLFGITYIGITYYTSINQKY